MKKLCKTEARLKKSVAYKKSVYCEYAVFKLYLFALTVLPCLHGFLREIFQPGHLV